MNGLKTVVMLGFLGAVGYVVYLSLTKNPRQAADSAAPLWSSSPKSHLSGPGSLLPQVPGGQAKLPPKPGIVAPTVAAPAPTVATPLPAGAPPPVAPVGLPETAPRPGPRPTPPPPPLALGAGPPPASPPAAATAPLSSPFGASLPPSASPPAAVAPPPTAPTALDPELAAQCRDFLNAVRAKLDDGRLDEGLVALGRLYEMNELPPEVAGEAAALLGQVAGTVIYSQQHVLEPPYEPQPGETLAQVAARYNVPAELLAKINGVADPAAPLPPGQPLKVLRGPFEAVVRLGRGELVLLLQGRYAGRFPIAVGADPAKLEGVYAVREKLAAPAYTAPDGTTIPGGHPANPYGRCALDLGGGAAIHGAADTRAVAQPGYPGILSLGDRDLDDVSSILSVGSRVVIQR